MPLKEFIASLHPFLMISGGVANFAMAFWILFAAPKTPGKLSLVHMAIAIGGYLTFFGSLSLPLHDATAFTLGKIGEVFVHQISPAFYAFSVFLLNLKRQRKIAYMAIPAGLALSALVLNMPGHHISHYWWGRFIGAAYHDATLSLLLYFLGFYAFSAASFVNLYRAYRQSTDVAFKRQMHYVIVAFAIAYIASVDYLPWCGIDLYPFGYIPLTLFTFVLSYTALRHKLMEASVFFARIFVVILIYSIIITLMMPVANALAGICLRSGFGERTSIMMIAFLIGGMLSTGPILYAHFVRTTYWLKGHESTGLAHELKSPISAIRGAIDFVQSQLQSGTRSEAMADYVSMIDENTARLEDYVEDLLHIAQNQDGIHNIDRVEADLVSLLNEIVDGKRALLQKKKLTVQISSPNVLRAYIDQEKIRQTLSNILSNAIKFSENCTINVHVEKTPQQCQVSVRDHGFGISAENLNRVFERFFQGRHSHQGSGIGLTIAKAWVEAHGGKIWAESDGEGMGTTVTFTLPVN
jgi:signal transduction histidine kinase